MPQVTFWQLSDGKDAGESRACDLIATAYSQRQKCVVLCADMRASAGYFIANNNTMKIQKIDDHAGLTLAGGVADAQNITAIPK